MEMIISNLNRKYHLRMKTRIVAFGTFPKKGFSSLADWVGVDKSFNFVEELSHMYVIGFHEKEYKSRTESMNSYLSCAAELIQSNSTIIVVPTRKQIC